MTASWESLVAGAKPWLKWPATLQAARETPALSHLLTYLTGVDTARSLVTETRAHFLSVARAAGLSAGKSAVFLQGGQSKDWLYYSADTTKGDEFKQEQYFRYLFGMNLPDLFGLLDLETEEVTLFVPDWDESCQRFDGPARAESWYGENFKVTRVLPEAQMKEFMQKQQYTTLHLLHGLNTDSGTVIEPPTKLISEMGLGCKVDVDSLHKAISEARVHKTPKEVEYLRAVSLVTSMGHVFLMRNAQMLDVEIQAEALFKSFLCYVGGARSVGYTCICGSGCNSAILHYGHSGRPNDRKQEDGDMLLYDMGGLFTHGYVTDVTCSWPKSGRFTADQRMVYEAVRAANAAVQAVLKPGTPYVAMHRLAERTILQHLVNAGVLVASVDELMAANMGAVFMPHGLGHLLGLDVHDVGGFNGAERCKDLGPCYLRTTRCMEEGMCITVEPGCYFVDFLLEKALQNPDQAKHINSSVLARFRGSGGVRIEDDVIITKDGCENLTIVPRTSEEIEELMALNK